MAKGAFIGFEVWFNSMRMAFKMQVYILMFCVAIQVLVGYGIYLRVLNDSQRSIIHTYAISHLGSPDDKLNVLINDRYVTLSKIHIQNTHAPYVKMYLNEYKVYGRYSFLVYLLIVPFNFLFGWKSRRQTDTKHIRGASLITPKEMNRLLRKRPTLFGKRPDVYLPIGEVKMPVSAEPKHTFIIGRPGVGKTVCISHILEGLIDRGDRCIIHDFKGDYLARFFRPDKDIIFNPLDARSTYWNFFDEIEDITDIDAIGYALIPDAKGAG
ncbi:MAG: type IV secretion system DNA-binding domain-containing protein, partial [Bacteroides sp.]